MKTYQQARLPFQGQKRRFLKPFKEALKGFESTATYVDLFGGSGLLSHNVKQMYPDATVVYNDYDNYQERLKNVEHTNEILEDFRVILKDYPDAIKISEGYKKQLLERISQENEFVDCITLSSSLLFSSKYVTELAEFKKQSLYNNLIKKNYQVDGYLEGVVRVQMDYKSLFEKYNMKNDVVFLIDPPYLSTDVSTYAIKNYWKLKDYLDVLKCLKHGRYFYFSSEKSQIFELCEWIASNVNFKNPFQGAIKKIHGVQLNKNSRYNDIMMYKNNLSIK